MTDTGNELPLQELEPLDPAAGVAPEATQDPQGALGGGGGEGGRRATCRGNANFKSPLRPCSADTHQETTSS